MTTAFWWIVVTSWIKDKCLFRTTPYYPPLSGRNENLDKSNSNIATGPHVVFAVDQGNKVNRDNKNHSLKEVWLFDTFMRRQFFVAFVLLSVWELIDLKKGLLIFIQKCKTLNWARVALQT